ncbi:MAG: bifunctional diaminohydroxyphosphoribosylaminopyrimidine deaminase/5-amino-6-(5-phosphoribosylamino)uracil reductase RibD [Coriobacteriia bacterium]|nr:bifunctional diaminohydroxyphosphoribosylaminopyrimidine deaminase/5-amino-6-(5-phosphoribosylamino)uracil reductase RibD [Coriobacteriia bacterium]
MRLFSDPAASVAEPMLARAYRLAERGRGATSPNPMVGCVLVREGAVVGEGFHERAGAPHAEAVALEAAGGRARGATAYVTLEPCNHHGRTPPCAEALVAAGVAEVVIGMPDRNPDVEGGGAQALSDEGVEVRFAEDPGPFEQLNEAWLKRTRTGLPWLDVKVALTLDGRPALAAQRRTAISSPEAARLTMRLRAAADAVAVGAATQRADDPLLTVRDEGGVPAARQPLRVVVCRTACPEPGARVLDPGLGPSLVLIPEDRPSGCDALSASGVECETYPRADGLLGALRALSGRGLSRVLLEAGPGLFTSAWEDDLVDRLILVHAGGVGGVSAPVLYLGQGSEAHGRLEREMRCVETGVLGPDAVTVWERRAAG